jgi:hypothetical protein
MKKKALFFGLVCALGAALLSFGQGTQHDSATFRGQITSTVSTGTAPFSIASTTLVPNLNVGLLGGLSAPASAILGLTDAQAPTNKTIDISLNTLKTATNTVGHTPRNNGVQYVDGQLGAADLSDGVVGTGSVVRATALQGTDASVLSSGTVSASAGVTLCTDANHGATTSGCSTSVVFQGDQTGLGANVGVTTLTTPGANGFYRMTCWVVLTRAATTSSTLPQCNALFTDPDSNQTQLIILTSTTTANGVGLFGPLGTGAQSSAGGFFAKSGVAIQYSTSGYVSSGATSMQYAVHVRLEGPF